MTIKNRNIFIVIGAAVLLTVSLLGYGVYRIYSFISPFMAMQEIPDELKESRVLMGGESFNKSELFKLEPVNLVETIGKGTATKDEKQRYRLTNSQVAKGIYNFADMRVVGDKVIAVGQFGAFTFDLNGNLLKQITFEPSTEEIKIGPYKQNSYQGDLDKLRIVDLGENRIGYLSSGFRQGVRIFDENGDEIWSYGKLDADLGFLFQNEKERDEHFEKEVYVLEAAVGDLDGDGVSEYVVAVKNEGIYAFDRDGTQKWFQPNKFPSRKLAICDLDGDGKNELIELGDSVRDGNGHVVRKIKGSENVIFVPDEKGKTNVRSLELYEGKLTYSDEDGSKLLQCQAPLSEILRKDPKKFEVPGHPEMTFTDRTVDAYRPRGVWVSFQKDKPKYLAVVAAFIGIPRADLYIYDSTGKLVYHEVLDQKAETIASAPASDGNEELLVGGDTTVWRYVMN